MGGWFEGALQGVCTVICRVFCRVVYRKNTVQKVVCWGFAEQYTGCFTTDLQEKFEE